MANFFAGHANPSSATGVPPPTIFGETRLTGANDATLQQSQETNDYWYGADGFDDDDDGMGGDYLTAADDDRDLKRRRIARACDMCRKKKIKCDGKLPKCTHCQNYKTECIFSPLEKKRAPPKGAKYIEGLENRLGRMEALLRICGLLTEDDNGRTDLGVLEKRLQGKQLAASQKSEAGTPASHNSVDGQSPVNSGTPLDQQHSLNSTKSSSGSNRPRTNSQKERSKDVDALADQMCSLFTNTYGESRYLGPSSGFSIFSPRGIKWIGEKIGDESFARTVASRTDDTQMEHWRPEVFGDIFARPVYKALPAKEECLQLMRDYFDNFNCIFPLFHQPTFMHLVEKQYSPAPYEGVAWWASLNVALAIAHRLRVMSNMAAQEEDDNAWGYLKNALAVQSELTMRSADLLAVQALLGMALFLQGSPNPQPAYFLVAAAIRTATSIGLHKRGAGFNFNEIEDEQRRRVFWIAYMVDKDICLRSGRPPCLDDDDINVELPSENPADGIGCIPLAPVSADSGRTVNMLRMSCEFAQIQSRVWKELYSVRAGQQSDGELLNTIGDLDAALEHWKDRIPIDIRPEHEINAAHTPLILHVVVMHFAYYNCLATIHRMSVHHGHWTDRLSGFALKGLNAAPLNPRVFMSAALCVNAARASINLIKYIPQGDCACVW